MEVREQENTWDLYQVFSWGWNLKVFSIMISFRFLNESIL